MMIIRPSHKQHVGLLPDDVSRGPKLSKSLSCVAFLDSAQPLSSYHIDALALRLSPDTKDICRDNSTTGALVRRRDGDTSAIWMVDIGFCDKKI